MSALDDVTVTYVDNGEDAAAFSRWLSESRPMVAIDTETTGLEFDARVRIAQVSDATTAWVIPIEMPRSFAGLLLDVLEKYRGDVIFHNAKFDLRVLHNTLNFQIDPGRVHDTMLQARILEPLHSAALKRLASRHVDARAASMQRVLDEAMDGGGHGWDTVPLTFEPYWFYAGLDTILTYRVFEQQMPKLHGNGMEAYQLERAVMHVLLKMERHGALIDDLATRRAYDALMNYGQLIAQWCKENFGVSPGKNLDVIRVLESYGWQFDKVTAMGAKSLDKEVLLGVDHPLADAVLRRRQAQKVTSTYLKHFLEDVDAAGRIHPTINAVKAKTSRMSMENPNLQNLPRRNNSNPAADLVRGCVSSAEGHELIMCDFDQVEFRIFSSLAPGDDLVRAFDADDVFIEMSRQLYRDPTLQKSDPRRQTMKNSVYTKLYGGGTKKFALTAGIPLHDAEVFNTQLGQLYPGIRQLQQAVELEVRQRMIAEGEAYVRSPLTGRRFALDDDGYYKLINYMIQGTATDVLKMKLVELDAAGMGDYLVCPVHDEVVAEVPDELVPDAARVMQQVMNDDKLFRVKITASVGHGQNWGAKEDYAA